MLTVAWTARGPARGCLGRDDAWVGINGEQTMIGRWVIAGLALAFGWMTMTMTTAQARADDATAGGVPLSLANARLNQGTLAPVAGNPRGVRATFRANVEWPTVVIDATSPWDWSRFGHLVLDLENPGPRPLSVSVRIDDDPSADGAKHCRTGQVLLGPGAKGRFGVRFAGGDPMEFGMRGLPAPTGFQSVTANGASPLQLDHITSVKIFLHKPAQDEVFIIRRAEVAPTVGIDGIVDRLGQYTRADWPGKVRDENDLKTRHAAEASELAARPALPGRDKFGGWADGPKRAATGFFRAEKVNGVWWLIDPDGRLFFSAGVDCVDLNHATMVTGRESSFTWLPEKTDPTGLALGYSTHVIRGPVKEGRTFDFYRANMVRLHGADFEPAWRERALKRLPSWGFNTIANWSSRSLYGNGQVPYTATASVGGKHARVASGSDYWGEMHDPFDPQFAIDARKSVSDVCAKIKDDPWCVGIFVDNELSWGGFDDRKPLERYGLALGALGSKADQPAKQAIVAQLRAKYGNVQKLNDAWKTSFARWEALADEPWTAPKDKGFAFTDAMREDLAAFVSAFATKYFETVRGAIREVDPNHMYLGCRFAWKTREAVMAAARACDVVSFNIYKRSVDPKDWAILGELGKPAIIGEYHVGALDRGMLHTGLVSAASQKERAEVFRGYVESVLDNPSLVGCHWFQYVDQPLTGRSFDGENYNIGLVTITDMPYPEMIDAARAVHATMYSKRAKAGGKVKP
jgi:hypothetical protein